MTDREREFFLENGHLHAKKALDGTLLARWVSGPTYVVPGSHRGVNLPPAGDVHIYDPTRLFSG